MLGAASPGCESSGAGSTISSTAGRISDNQAPWADPWN
jgi:hypothetical protein